MTPPFSQPSLNGTRSPKPPAKSPLTPGEQELFSRLAARLREPPDAATRRADALIEHVQEAVHLAYHRLAGLQETWITALYVPGMEERFEIAEQTWQNLDHETPHLRRLVILFPKGGPIPLDRRRGNRARLAPY